LNDEELVKNLIKKDKQSFDEFMDEYSIDILKTISYVLREREEKEYIEECFNDVIIIIFDKCDKFKFEASFKTWIMTIAKNKALDYKRKLMKLSRETEINETLQIEFNIEDNYINSELGKEINDVINELKDDERKLFINKYILDLSTKELCQYYFISENLLYKRLSRVREKFKKLWSSNHNNQEVFYEEL
jgi:RNA polymerase sigma-70 factor, ECF subfamily